PIRVQSFYVSRTNFCGIKNFRLNKLSINMRGLIIMIKNIIRGFIVLCAIGAACSLPKKAYKQYLPVTLFSTACQLVEILYFTLHKLWKVKGGPKSAMCHASILVVGPYFFSNLWAFHLSKGKFVRYFFINLIADLIYAFPVVNLFSKLNFFKLKVSSKQFFSLIFTNALLNYGFQKFYEKFSVPSRARE